MEKVKKNSRKILNTIIVFIATICVLVELNNVYAQDFTEISLKVEDPTIDNYYALILIPESYVKYVNELTGYNCPIDEVTTRSDAHSRYLRYFDTDDLLQNMYTENGIKYLQLKMDNIADNFTFNVAPGVSVTDFKLRIVAPDMNEVFSFADYELEEEGDLKLLYNYETKELKTDNKLQLQVNKLVVILGVLLIVMCLVNYAERLDEVHQKRKNY